MITAGFKLTVLGMGVVISFLLLLILFIDILRRLLASGNARELEAMKSVNPRNRKKDPTGVDEEVLTAVISAAIAAHRSRG